MADHESIVAGDEEGGLGGLRLRDAEEGRQRVDRRGVGRLDILHRQECLGRGIGFADDRDLLVVGEVARVADDEGVLTEVVDDHELMGPGAAHDPDVGADHDRIETEPLEDPLVGDAVLVVAHVEPGVVEIAGIGVLHDEFANPDEAATGARLVSELRLEVVDDHRQLAVALDDVAEKDGDDLLVGHRQDHVALAAILEPDQLRPDLCVAPTFLPDLGRVDDGHLHLLPADGIDLLADDLLDAVADPLAQRQQRIDARPELADVARAQQQPMRRHLGIGGVVAERGEEQVGESHGRQG